jgi:hypothetical protein
MRLTLRFNSASSVGNIAALAAAALTATPLVAQVQTIVPQSTAWYPEAMAVANGRVYFTSLYHAQVWSAPPDGSGPAEILASATIRAVTRAQRQLPLHRLGPDLRPG